MYDDKVYVEIIKSYLQKNGFDVSSYSKNTFLKQLHQRMQNNNYSTYETYHSFLQENEEEFTQLKNSFSINVTSFFRDPEVYEAFRVFFAIYLKEILQRNHRSKIRIWSAGCANGSEPYSIVINLHQTLKKHLNDYSIRIFATDINSEVLSTAKAGIYEESIKEEVPKEILNQYFCQNPQGRFSISNNIKNYVSFSELDLLSNRFHFDYIDVIFCRYVLMYFKES